MTTEIAVMNKSAVALAADSAVTISMAGPHGKIQKVLNTANKLFSLSKCAPVGLMIYGNAGMLGIPWETIVKMYREQLKDKQFSTLSMYATDFFKYLDKFDVGEDLQRVYVLHVARSWAVEIRRRIDNWVEEQFQLNSSKPVTESEIKSALAGFIKSEYDSAIKAGKTSRLSQNKRSSLRQKHREDIRRICDEVFEKRPLSAQMHSRLLTISVNVACISRGNQSGIVIAGFGSKDLYPQCYDYDVAAVLAGTTVKSDVRSQKICHKNTAVIMPFAQSDEVKTFMEGIGPTLNSFLNRTFRGIFTELLPKEIGDEAETKLNLSKKQAKDLRKMLTDISKGACETAFKVFEHKKHEDYIDPVVQASTFLNKEELASMAETLVNLVSFRKQVTMETETVGGPIDVAVISKGDGFIWVKHKNYFPAELNHHFFSNYHREVYRNGK